MKQTAVEWLFIQLYAKFKMQGDGKAMNDILKKAIAMEKEQIINAHDNGKNILPPNENGEQYYNEKYKNN